MSTYIPPTDFCPDETPWSYVCGVTCKFVGPALLMVTLNEDKTALSEKQLKAITFYMISEGILTEEHKAWLAKNNKKIQFFVVNHEHRKLELDWKCGLYLPTW